MAAGSAHEHESSRPLLAEMGLVIACARHALDPSIPIDTREQGRRVNWNHVLWLARQYRMLLPVANVFADSAGGECPEVVRAQLESYRVTSVVDRLRRLRKLYRLQAALGSATDELMMTAVSDPLLAHCYTRGEVLRDIDGAARYLVPAPARERAQALLESKGYTDRPLELARPDAGRIVLEPRSGAGQRAGWGTADPSEVFARSSSVELGSVRVRVPAPIDLLLALSTRIAAADRLPLGHAVDLLALTRRTSDAEWEEALSLARALGVESEFIVGSAASHSIVCLELPAPVARWLAERPALETRSHSVAERPCVPAADETKARVKAMESRLASHGIAPRAMSKFLPTPTALIEAFLRIARPGPDDTVYDLGCGDGRIVEAAAAQFGARAVGVDFDEALIAIARGRLTGLPAAVAERVRFIKADVYDVDLRDATVVCLYTEGFALDRVLQEIVPKLNPGTRIVAHSVSFRSWPATATEIVSWGGHSAIVHLWVVEDRGISVDAGRIA